jgi:hypothetical protein
MSWGNEEDDPMISAAKRAVPWVSGLLSYAAWKLGRLLIANRSHEAGMASRRVCVIQAHFPGEVLMVSPQLQALTEAFGAGMVDVVLTRQTALPSEHFPGLGSRVFWPHRNGRLASARQRALSPSGSHGLR